MVDIFRCAVGAGSGGTGGEMVVQEEVQVQAIYVGPRQDAIAS